MHLSASIITLLGIGSAVAQRRVCPDANGLLYIASNNGRYLIECEIEYWTPINLHSSETGGPLECADECDLWTMYYPGNPCGAGSWEKSTSVCYLKPGDLSNSETRNNTNVISLALASLNGCRYWFQDMNKTPQPRLLPRPSDNHPFIPSLNLYDFLGPLDEMSADNGPKLRRIAAVHLGLVPDEGQGPYFYLLRTYYGGGADDAAKLRSWLDEDLNNSEIEAVYNVFHELAAPEPDRRCTESMLSRRRTERRGLIKNGTDESEDEHYADAIRQVVALGGPPWLISQDETAFETEELGLIFQDMKGNPWEEAMTYEGWWEHSNAPKEYRIRGKIMGRLFPVLRAGRQTLVASDPHTARGDILAGPHPIQGPTPLSERHCRRSCGSDETGDSTYGCGRPTTARYCWDCKESGYRERGGTIEL
ncbi:hypothetical protein N657DRAFT_675849 [Parathielavia appendiculata]|uniref:Uncharacterized protein n=1 Tax=Parathielavia appendiculata TaxID=2587402 RepID=A0AAN6TPV7_9PEZI|nr:hypothetical protein N657DRAFT_675849 [Parathielavia appendiculata]